MQRRVAGFESSLAILVNTVVQCSSCNAGAKPRQTDGPTLQSVLLVAPSFDPDLKPPEDLVIAPFTLMRATALSQGETEAPLNTSHQLYMSTCAVNNCCTEAALA